MFAQHKKRGKTVVYPLFLFKTNKAQPTLED
jgi:hypothetical protein